MHAFILRFSENLYKKHRYAYHCTEILLLHNSPGSDYLDGEPEARETVAPVENHVQHTVAPVENHVQHQDPLEYKAGNVIYDETYPEEHIPSFPSSTDVKRDSPLAPPHPPLSPTLQEPVEEAPKTYASVVSKYRL
jgi:hypothetical protein